MQVCLSLVPLFLGNITLPTCQEQHDSDTTEACLAGVQMRLHPALLIAFLAAALAIVEPASAAPSYTLTVNPSYPVIRGTTMTLTLSLAGGTRNSAYNVLIGVTKPNGTGQANVVRTFSTDNRGVGGTTLAYPDPSFTALNGTVQSDVEGVYTFQVNQTSPSFQAGVASAQFTVIAQLTVVLSQPAPGVYVQRGQKLTITASVSDLGGPVTTAAVSANAPGNGRIYLQQISNGIYSALYTILVYDPLGQWSIRVSASDSSGNSGSSGSSTITITKGDLVVDSLTAYNSKGVPTVDFSPGDTIYPFFRLKYSTGDPLTSGQFRAAIENPSGRKIANLTGVYDASRFGFYTTTGYLFSQSDPGGSWAIVVDAGSVDDGFGNVGPSYPTSVKIQVTTGTSPWSSLPFAIGGVVALLSGVFLLKRYDKSSKGFEQLEQMMSGPMPRGSSILILGDPGSGKTILSYEFLYDELETGMFCAVLSYDAFPEDVQARMMEFGWDITSHLRKGRLRIVDCYSGLSGEGEGSLKDPSDLTELNIRVTSIIGHAKGKPVTLVLDSLTPIFNGVESKQAIAFLQTVGAKVKKTGGVFFATGSTGAVAAEALAKIKSFTDGVIELTLVRNHHKTVRFLSILKMERRKISAETIPFEIDRRRGLVFHVSRVKSTFQRIHAAEQALEHGSLQKADGRPKQPTLDKAQRPPTTPRFQDSKQPLDALPPWGHREAPAAQAEFSQSGARKSTTPGIFHRLKAATDKLWRVPPEPSKDRPPGAIEPVHPERSTRQDKPTVPRLEQPERNTTQPQPSSVPMTNSRDSPPQTPELPRKQPASSPGKSESERDRAKSQTKSKPKDASGVKTPETTEPQSSSSTPLSSDETDSKTPTPSSA